jgi:hypothetical protein
LCVLPNHVLHRTLLEHGFASKEGYLRGNGGHDELLHYATRSVCAQARSCI